jgi:hypothetical protein
MTNARKIFIASLLLGLSGWFTSLGGSWGLALTPQGLSGLCIVMASILAPALMAGSIKENKK